MCDDDEIPAVVVDNGSGLIKAGFAGDDCHRVVIPTVLANLDQDEDTPSKYVFGDELRSGTNKYELVYPMEYGLVTNWDQMELIWTYMFYKELRVNPEEYPCLMTEPVLNPRSHREKTAQVMFESFRVPAFYICDQGRLALYASGRGSGIVVNSGDTVTDCMAIYEGYPVMSAMARTDLGGRDLTNYLSVLLRQKGYSFETMSERDIVRIIKERLCYVASNMENELYDARMSRKIERNYELPDGTVMAVNEERFRCPEAIFKPKLMGSDEPGLTELVHQSLCNCDIDTRSDLYCNIIISGGNTMFPGLTERLQSDLIDLTPATTKVKVVAPPERRSSVWIGGSIIASLSTFQQMWFTRQDYEEYGPAYIHRTCIT